MIQVSVSQSVFRGTLGFRQMYLINEKLILYYIWKKYYFMLFKKKLCFKLILIKSNH
jgi:hypothetical protein